MAREIVAYMSDDGVIHLNKEEADFADFSSAIKSDVGGFLKQQNNSDVDGNVARLIIRWEMWKVGDFAGWVASQPEAVQVIEPEPVCVVDISRLTHKPSPEVRAQIEAPKKIEPYKKRVAVVGLFPGVQPGIGKEFGDLFKLSLLNSDETRKIPGLREFHKVFLMARFVSHKHLEMLRAVGQEPFIIRGGVNELKDALTTYYATT